MVLVLLLGSYDTYFLFFQQQQVFLNLRVEYFFWSSFYLGNIKMAGKQQIKSNQRSKYEIEISMAIISSNKSSPTMLSRPENKTPNKASLRT
jgi:hypothetical protein